MASDPIDKLLRPRRERAYRGKGRVYSWLRARHAEIEALMARGEASWAGLAARLAESDLLGRDGQAPTRNAMIRVWKRVCRDAAAEAAAQAAARPARKHPSRMSSAWRPEVIPPAKVPPAGRNLVPAPARAVPAPRPPVQPAALPSTPEEVKEAALRDLEKLDWHFKLQ